MDSNRPNIGELRETLSKFSKEKTSELLSALGRYYKFAEALNSEIGKELLSDLVKIYRDKLDLIIAEEASKEDIAEFRVAKQMLGKWFDRIESYNRASLQAVKIIKGDR